MNRLSFCENCYSMTKNICGKCETEKIPRLDVESIQVLGNLCTSCGKEIKRIGVMSPTLNAKRRCMCMACSKKIYTYPELGTSPEIEGIFKDEIERLTQIIDVMRARIQLKDMDKERTNKKVKELREELKSARELWGETIHQKNIQINNIFLNAKKRNNKELIKVHKRLERLWRCKQTWQLVSIVFLIGYLIMCWIALL
jgi:hypothetical protein